VAKLLDSTVTLVDTNTELVAELTRQLDATKAAHSARGIGWVEVEGGGKGCLMIVSSLLHAHVAAGLKTSMRAIQ
jgi:hypothetical protein